MIPGKYNIDIWRGATWSISLQADAVDFATYDEIRMQIRPPWIKGMPTQPALLELSLENGRITLENGNLTVKLEVSAADTGALDFDEGIYDLEFVKHAAPEANPAIPVEIVDKLIYGKVSVKGEVTV